VNRRSRILAFGGAGLLVVAGAVCAVVIGGGLGQILALVLIGLGLVAVTSLVFFEVGLSEDRQRTRDAAAVASARRARDDSPAEGPGAGPEGPGARERRAPRPRLGRMRGQSRRLKR
jgi:hypothetical protein